MPRVKSKMNKSKNDSKPYVSVLKTPAPVQVEEEPMDIWAIYRKMLAEDADYQAMLKGTLSWADTLDEPTVTEEDVASWRQAQANAEAERAHKLMLERIENAKANYDMVVRQLNNRRIAIAISQEHLEDYYEAKMAWLLTNEEYVNQDPDELGMAWESHWEERYDEWFRHETKDIHRDENGEPEICRYFSSPGGCKLPDGKKCPYKHVAGAEPEPCRFFNSPRGCNKGSSCPFKHVTVAESAPTWRQSHDDWRSETASVSSFRSSANDGWTLPKTNGRPPRAPQPRTEECRFFKSRQGCNKGASCPYKH